MKKTEKAKEQGQKKSKLVAIKEKASTLTRGGSPWGFVEIIRPNELYRK